ncbi:MAG: ATP-binding protein, partial [Gammaproteobacteria bacterium]|nr:ATP-binding protein [Gammaproteobacteria bacterium]
VGTNAEIVLGNRDRLLAASSPTGPAFEGAQISCGQRAASGAIERVRIDRQTFEPRFRVIGCELWSDEPGFAEATAAIGVSGVCGSGIIEVIAELYLAGVINRDGVIMPPAGKSSRIIADGRTYAYLLHEQDGVVLKITQNDVRAIQLAKAALYAGIKLLMDHLGISRPDKILIAGAFGSHIDARYAMVLGLIPDCRLSNVISIGNAAGTGARIALMDHKERRLIESVLRQVEKIETAIEPRFQEHFVEAMAIPHKTDSFEMLRKELSLPETTGSDEGREQRSAGRPGARRRRKKSA